MFALHQVQIGEDLTAICDQMQPGEWAADNEMTSYQPELLKKFLEAGGILVLAQDGDSIAGAALCYELLYPAGQHSLYVHELDTHPDYRRQGVATQLVDEAKKIAKAHGLIEVWIGTETDNDPANALYKALKPFEIEPSLIYAYKVN